MATEAAPQPNGPALPRAPVERWLSPIRQFMHIEAAGGIVLLACAAVALGLANSPVADWYKAVWKTPVELAVGSFRLAGDVGHLVVNDGLMTLFFFLVGLEIKREVVAGELRDPRRAMLPVFGAVGGMLVPAGVYLAMQWGTPAARGWAIPTATDIAFVVGVLALFGRHIPFGLKVLMLTLAVVDDIGAVLIIAVAYGGPPDMAWLAAAGGGLLLIAGMNRVGVRSVGAYAVVGAVVWLAAYRSGVHPTVAGVLLGLMTPAGAWVSEAAFRAMLDEARDRTGDANSSRLRFAARESLSPLHRLEVALHPWVAFGIMPVFALANAGVLLRPEAAGHPVALAVAVGLVVGKPVGVLLAAWLAVRVGVARMPDGVTWAMLAGGACLAGIGFTMSLFINGLAFPADDYSVAFAAGKIGTFAGSILSAGLGVGILVWAIRGRAVSQG